LDPLIVMIGRGRTRAVERLDCGNPVAPGHISKMPPQRFTGTLRSGNGSDVGQ